VSEVRLSDCLGTGFYGLIRKFQFHIVRIGTLLKLNLDIERLDTFQTNITREQKSQFASNSLCLKWLTLEKLIEVAMDKVLLQVKDSIGLPFQIDPMPSSFTIKAP
jgi:hypothetical protein